jgi:hypothetical protein
MRKALLDFIDVINSTGGVVKDSGGYFVPVADTYWIDLGESYIKACKAVGVEPKVTETLNGAL